jgi:hypothetical protein
VTPTKVPTVVASIAIALHDNGAMSISGNIGDVKLALQMIDHARDAIKARLSTQPEIIIPNRDVAVVQDHRFPTKPFGDMPAKDRGDQPSRLV